MAHPVQTLANIRQVLTEDGAVLIADERVSETFTAPADFNDRLMYGWGVLHCLPATMAEHPTIATGTVLRPSILRRYASDAGFHRAQELTVDNDFCGSICSSRRDKTHPLGRLEHIELGGPPATPWPTSSRSSRPQPAGLRA
jgi:hypothetical protein